MLHEATPWPNVTQSLTFNDLKETSIKIRTDSKNRNRTIYIKGRDGVYSSDCLYHFGMNLNIIGTRRHHLESIPLFGHPWP